MDVDGGLHALGAVARQTLRVTYRAPGVASIASRRVARGKTEWTHENEHTVSAFIATHRGDVLLEMPVETVSPVIVPRPYVLCLFKRSAAEVGIENRDCGRTCGPFCLTFVNGSGFKTAFISICTTSSVIV
jgi:hypothetical protein